MRIKFTKTISTEVEVSDDLIRNINTNPELLRDIAKDNGFEEDFDYVVVNDNNGVHIKWQ